jgi:hypothetical protein
MAKRELDLEVVSYGPGVGGWQGYVQPKSLKWILYVHRDGTPVLYTKRTKSGACIGPPLVAARKSAAPTVQRA